MRSGVFSAGYLMSPAQPAAGAASRPLLRKGSASVGVACRAEPGRIRHTAAALLTPDCKPLS